MKSKKTLYFLLVVLLFTSCNQKEELDEENSQNMVEPEIVEDEQPVKKDMTLGIMVSLLDKIEEESFVANQLDSLDFRKKFNGVYISRDTYSIQEPKHWVHINSMGSYSNVSFSTGEIIIWEKLVDELKKYGKPKPFDNGNSFESKKYVGKKYTFEVHKPKNGVDLSLNNLYQILVSFTKK